MLAAVASSAFGAVWSLSGLSQIFLLTVILLVTWYQVAMTRQKNLLRSVHPDIFIISQPLALYTPLMFLLPRTWLRWLFPYRATDMHEILHETFTKTGARAIGFASPGHAEVYFNDEDIIREFAVKQHEKFPKAYKDYEVLRFWGDNIVTAPSEGYEWKKHRHVPPPTHSYPLALCTPAFSSGNLRLVAKVTVQNTNALIKRWDQELQHVDGLGEVTDVLVEEDTMRLMLYVIAGAGFGQEFGFDKSDDDYDKSKFTMSFKESVACVCKNLLLWIAFRPVFKLPLPSLRKVREGFHNFEAHVKDMINTRKSDVAAEKENEGKKEVQEGKETDETEDNGQRNDLLSLLLKSRDEDARISLTDEEVFSDAFIFLLAGHETTAHSTAWAFALLATNPHEQERLHEEVKAVLGDRDPTYDDFDQLVYAQCVFKETLRLVPPVWALGKYCAESTKLIDHNVTPDIRTTMAIYSIHRNPKYWEQPDKFMPSRFDTRVNPPVSAYSYIPFSLGRRSCIGNRFAMVEGTMFLSMVMQKYTIHLTPGTDLKTLFEGDNVITITPRHPMHMLLKRRK